MSPLDFDLYRLKKGLGEQLRLTLEDTAFQKVQSEIFYHCICVTKVARNYSYIQDIYTCVLIGLCNLKAGAKNIMSFGNKWIKPHSESVGNKLLEGIKPQAPLKPRIEEAQKRLQMQISKLDSIATKTLEKDQLIFKRVVHAMQNHDSQYAKVLSGELSQVRKMNKMVTSAKLALEQIQLRLNTITELGDVVVTLSPAMSVIKGVQGGLSSMMPEADQSLGQISDLLGNIMSDSGQIPDAEISGSNTLTEDALKIIEEASAVVEESTKDKFPDLPSSNLQSRKAESSIY